LTTTEAWLEPQAGPRGLLKYYILKLLSDHEATGYAVIKSVADKTGGSWRPGAGSVYPLLNQLCEKGYIAVERVGPRGQKIYRITPKGLQKLEEARSLLVKAANRWLSLHPLLYDIVGADVVGEMLIRASKHHFQRWKTIVNSQALSRGEKVSFLKEMMANLERELLWLKAQLQEFEGTSNH
jgi:DNA-binding PadR family transcriptional regulator